MFKRRWADPSNGLGWDWGEIDVSTPYVVAYIGVSLRRRLHRDSFVDQHGGDVVPYGIQELAVRTNEPAIKFLSDGLAGAVFQVTAWDSGVEFVQQGRFSGAEILVGFGAAEQSEEAGINH